MVRKRLQFFVLFIFCVSCKKSSLLRPDQGFERIDRQGMRSSLAPRGDEFGHPKKSVLVFDFWNDTPVRQEGLGVWVANELKRGLALTQRVVIPLQIQSLPSTEDFLEGERLDVPRLIAEGRKIGVSVLVLGRIKKISFRQNGDEVGILRQKESLGAVEVEIKVFDIHGGREILAQTQVGESSDQVMLLFNRKDTAGSDYRAALTEASAQEAVALLIPDILRSVEKLVWQGRIARLTGPKIFINAGKASGLIHGDILRVLTGGEDVYDPTSGLYLGRSPGQVKGTVEIIDFMGVNGAVAQIHTGGNFREGDLVQLY